MKKLLSILLAIITVLSITILPVSAVSATEYNSHELIYHAQSGYIDVSKQVQGLANYAPLSIELPNGRIADIKFYASSLNPESLTFGQPVPAPAGCTSWQGTLICLKHESTGDWNYVPVYYCYGCTYNHDKNYTCTCYATYNGSGYELNTPAAFFHTSFPIHINYTDGTSENTVSYFNPKLYYGADGKSYYLGIPNSRMETRQFEILTPETRNYWNSLASGYNTYIANHLSSSQKQPSFDNGYQAFCDNAYELCNKQGCMRTVYHGSPIGSSFLIKEISYEDYGKFAATKPDRNDMQEYFDGCLNVEVIDTGTSFKVYCKGHYVCTGCHTGNTVQNTDVPVRYCTKNNENQLLVKRAINQEKTSLLVDYDKGIVYNFKVGTSKLEDYLVTNKGYSYKYNRVGTGHKIDFFFNQEKIGSLTMVVYGDINGDTWCSEKDYDTIKGLATATITKGEIGQAQALAADVNRDGIISMLDVDIAAKAVELYNEYQESSLNLQALTEYNELINQGEVEIEEKPAEKRPSLLERFIAALNKILAFFGLHIEL